MNSLSLCAGVSRQLPAGPAECVDVGPAVSLRSLPRRADARVEGKNRALRMFGYSPMQLLFGRELQLPGCLLGQEVDVVASSMRLHAEDQFSRSHRWNPSDDSLLECARFIAMDR